MSNEPIEMADEGSENEGECPPPVSRPIRVDWPHGVTAAR